VVVEAVVACSVVVAVVVALEAVAVIKELVYDWWFLSGACG
jgi:hypothetical protein